MDPLHNPPEDTKLTSWYSPLFRVTFVSKSLALTLIILLPFIGGWIGYKLEQNNSHIENSITNVDTSNATNVQVKNVALDTSIGIGESVYFQYGSYRQSTLEPIYVLTKDSLFTQLNKKKIPYNSQKIVVERTSTNGNFGLYVTKLSNKLTIVAMSSEGAEVVSFIYDESKGVIVKENPFMTPMNFGIGGPTYWVQFNDEGYLATVECPRATNCQPTVKLYDYMSGKSNVLYTETRPDVRLAEVCEMGCSGGILGSTFDGDLLIAAYTEPFKPENKMFATYFETIKVPLPTKFKNELQNSIYEGYAQVPPMSTEKITLDISPFSNAKLVFNVSAQKMSSTSLFSEAIKFDKETGDIFLLNYYTYNSNTKDPLLKLYTFNSNYDLEKNIQDLVLNQFAIDASSSVENILLEKNEEIKTHISESGQPANDTNFDFYNFCKLETLKAFSKPVYVLRPLEQYEANAWPYLCGFGKYIFFDTFVVANYAQPVDATQPKVIPYDEIELVE